MYNRRKNKFPMLSLHRQMKAVRRRWTSRNKADNNYDKKKLSSSSSSSTIISLCLEDDTEASYRTSTSSTLSSPPLNIYMMLPSSSSPSRSSSKDQEQQIGDKGKSVVCEVSTEEQTMSKPTTTSATTTTTTSSSICHGVISVIGRRRSMEDAVTIAPSLVRVVKHNLGKEEKVVKEELMEYDFFGMYDGHGGRKVAQKCKERLHHFVAEEFDVVGMNHHWESVMTTSFARMDDVVASIEEEEDGGVHGVAETTMGATALVVLVGKEEIVVANCGNSRVVLYRNGAALPLSCDYNKPGRPEEKEAGKGAVGDTYIKPRIIFSPDVTVQKRTISDDFLVIASDGLWDVLSNEMACDIVTKCCSGEVVCKKMVVGGVVPNRAAASAAMLVELALARGSKDNISVIVVKLQRPNANGSSSSA